MAPTCICDLDMFLSVALDESHETSLRQAPGSRSRSPSHFISTLFCYLADSKKHGRCKRNDRENACRRNARKHGVLYIPLSSLFSRSLLHLPHTPQLLAIACVRGRWGCAHGAVARSRERVQ